jgi:hypothetical protein
MSFRPLPTPSGTGQLQCIVNVSQSIIANAAFRSKEVLWTDTEKLLPEGDQSISYGDLIDYGNSLSPAPRMGFYHSISDAVIDPMWYITDPPMHFLATDFFESELLSGYTNTSFPGYPDLRIVDYAQSSARTKLINTLVARAQSFKDNYGVDLVYLDNCRHPANGGTSIAWADTLSYISDLRTALHAINVALIVNFTMPPGLGTDTSNRDIWTALGPLVEGVSFESPVLREQINTSTAVANLVTDYQAMIDANCTPIMLVNQSEAVGATSTERYINESNFLARLAMILQGPLVGQYFYLPEQDWFTWPTTYGSPTGPIVQDGMQLSRQFGAATITVDFAARVAEVAGNVGTQLLVQLERVRNAATFKDDGLYANDANVTFTVTDQAGAIISSESMAYVPGTDGTYQGVILKTAALSRDQVYRIVAADVDFGPVDELRYLPETKLPARFG